VNPLGNESNGIGANKGDRNDQDACKGDVEGDLKAVQYATGATNDASQNWAKHVVTW